MIVLRAPMRSARYPPMPADRKLPSPRAATMPPTIGGRKARCSPGNSARNAVWKVPKRLSDAPAHVSHISRGRERSPGVGTGRVRHMLTTSEQCPSVHLQDLARHLSCLG